MNSRKEKTENLIKLFLVTAKDIRIVLMKLADRCHNVQASNALETLQVYAPIADRLGMGELKCQLENLAFKYLHPKEYKNVESEVTKRYQLRKNDINKLEKSLYEILGKENIIPVTINARIKHLYSIYKKLLPHQMNFDEIYDLVAARVIAKDVNDCYLALGAIHQAWEPISGLIKDYIARPKPNGYQSLHTSVLGPKGKTIEIQIRTPEMHAQAENGIAAHWAYKEGKVNTKETVWNDDKFFESLKTGLFEGKIFVLTPHGDAIDLPEGATPVDFAYHVHTTVGNECAGVKINGKIATLDAKLKSGDLVEILTQKGKKSPIDWLTFVKTDLAKNKIRSVLREKNKKLQFKIR
ncbi:MAG: TGS domain-containing protein [Candidatus Azambacteria bacterium]|nr:TGS domain-containing protein [Candidatus Azambacteria bacterium]